MVRLLDESGRFIEVKQNEQSAFLSSYRPYVQKALPGREGTATYKIARDIRTIPESTISRIQFQEESLQQSADQNQQAIDRRAADLIKSGQAMSATDARSEAAQELGLPTQRTQNIQTAYATTQLPSGQSIYANATRQSISQEPILTPSTSPYPLVSRVEIPKQLVDIRSIPQPPQALNKVSAISYVQGDIIETKPGTVEQGAFIKFIGSERSEGINSFFLTEKPLTKIEYEAVLSGKKQIPIYKESPSFSFTPLKSLSESRPATIKEVQQSERAIGVTSPEQAFIEKFQGYQLSDIAKESSAIGFGVLAAQIALQPPRQAVKVLSPSSLKTEAIGIGKIKEYEVSGTKVSAQIETKGGYVRGASSGKFEATTVSTQEFEDVYPKSFEVTSGSAKEKSTILSKISGVPVYREEKFYTVTRSENLGEEAFLSQSGRQANLKAYRNVGITPEFRGGTVVKENVLIHQKEFDVAAASEFSSGDLRTSVKGFYTREDLSSIDVIHDGRVIPQKTTNVLINKAVESQSKAIANIISRQPISRSTIAIPNIGIRINQISQRQPVSSMSLEEEELMVTQLPQTKSDQLIKTIQSISPQSQTQTSTTLTNQIVKTTQGSKSGTRSGSAQLVKNISGSKEDQKQIIENQSVFTTKPFPSFNTITFNGIVPPTFGQSTLLENAGRRKKALTSNYFFRRTKTFKAATPATIRALRVREVF